MNRKLIYKDALDPYVLRLADRKKTCFSKNLVFINSTLDTWQKDK